MGMCAETWKSPLLSWGLAYTPYKDRVALKDPFVEMPTRDENPLQL